MFLSHVMRNRPRPRHNNRLFRNNQRLVPSSRIHRILHQVIHRYRPIQNRPAPQYRTRLHHRPFIHAAIPAHHHVILNNHRHRPHRLQHAPQLRRRRNMTVSPDLRAAPYQRMRIDHRVFADIRAHIHKHRRHANHSAPDVTPIPHARSARHNPHSIRHIERSQRIRRLIDERLPRLMRQISRSLRARHRHIHRRAHSKSQQNSLLHPRVRPPAAFRRRIRLRRAHFAAIQRRFKRVEQLKMLFLIFRRRMIEQLFNLRRQHAPFRQAQANSTQ